MAIAFMILFCFPFRKGDRQNLFPFDLFSVRCRGNLFFQNNLFFIYKPLLLHDLNQVIL